MKKPTYPLLCRSLYCGETDTDGAWCRNCSNRPELDNYHRQKEAYEAHQAREDHTGASAPYCSPALAGWGGGDR